MAELKTLEEIPVEWSPGDVILGIYEVRPVTEGFGVHARERPYHEGGFGRVYKVWHRGWQRDMAVKVPRPEVFVTEAQKEAFARECKIWVNLGLHPHVASCYYIRELGGILRIFSDYSNADTLEAWIRSRRLYEGGERAVLAQILDAAIQFAWGLHYAHEQGVIHRDVKPLNALMGDDGTLRVTDFGIARARENAGGADTIGAPSGGMGSMLVSSGTMTPLYCSPEQRAGEQLDRRTDVWSWAVSVLQMFCGEVSWLAGSAAAEALATYTEDGRHIDGIPLMPAKVFGLLRDCFRRNPADRPRTLHDCAEHLRKAYHAEMGQVHSRTEPPPIADTPESLNNRGVSLLDLGRAEDACAAWSKALEKHPRHFEATYNLQVQLWERGRVTDQAVVIALDEARKNRKNDWAAAYYLGLVHLARRDGTSAKYVLEEAVKLGGGKEVQAALLNAEELLHQGGFCVRTFERPMNGMNYSCHSSDGRLALSTNRDRRTFNLVNISSGRCLKILGPLRYTASSAGLSLDGSLALFSKYDGTIDLWDVFSGQCTKTLKGHTSVVHSVHFSNDGRWVLSGGTDNTLRLWEISSGRCVRIFKGHSGWVRTVCLSADGCLALSGSEDWTIRLWVVSSGRCLRIFEGHNEYVSSVSLSRDARIILSVGYDDTIRLWEVATGRCLRTFEGLTDRAAVFVSINGLWTLSGSQENTLRLRDEFRGPDRKLPAYLSQLCQSEDMLTSQTCFNELLKKARSSLKSGQIADALGEIRKARSLTGYEANLEALDVWAKVGQFSVKIGLRAGWCVRTFAEHTSLVSAVCLSVDGRWALSGAEDHVLRLWDVSSDRCVRTFKGHTEGVSSVCLSSDSSRALSGSLDGNICIWDVSSGRCLHSFKAHGEGVSSVCLSPNGRWAFSTSWNEIEPRLWDLSNGRCVRTFKGYTDGGVISSSMSSDGRLVLTGGIWGIPRLWELSSGRCIRVFEGDLADYTRFCLSADGRWAFSGGDDGTLRSWDVSMGRCVRTFKGHTGPADAVCMSPDGRWAVSGGRDESLRLWEVATGRCMWNFKGHYGSVNSVVLSSDGRWMLSGSTDKTVRLWELDWEYKFPGWADYDDGADSYLRNLLDIRNGQWTAEDFNSLITELSHCSYGWLRIEGVKRKLKEMTDKYIPREQELTEELSIRNYRSQQEDMDTSDRWFTIRAAGATDIGCVRELNEDAFWADAQNGVFIVADGLGGRHGGDTASRMVVEVLPGILQGRTADLSIAAMGTEPNDCSILEAGILEVSQAIREAGEKNPAILGMGATVLSVWVVGRHANIAHMGDSRAYILRGGGLWQLTEDHSMVGTLLRHGEISAQEAMDHPARGRLTRFAGMVPAAEPALQNLALRVGDRLLLCTDGLWGMVGEGKLRSILAGRADPESTCRALIDAGRAAGGADNLTAVVVDVSAG